MRFRQKMLLAMVWLLTLTYGVGGVLLIRQSFRSSLEQEKTNAAAAYEMTLQAVQLVNQMDIQQDFSSIRIALSRMEGAAGQTALRLSRDGEELFRTGEVFQPLLAREDFLLVRFSDDGRHYLQISGPVSASADPLCLDIVYEITPIYTARARQIETYRRILLLLLAGGGLVSWLTAWLLTLPLGRLSATAGRLAAGNLNARVRARGNSEISRLGNDFDRMADRLEENIGELKLSVERQERFMGSFAHEMKTPMTSIIGYADLLRSQSLDPAEAQEAAAYIFSEGKRLESLSFKLLDLLLLRHQELKRVPTEMAGMITGLAEHLRPIFREAGITLECSAQVGICRVEPDLFRSVLTNLLDNARKAVERGGVISVTGEPAEGEYRIRVRDNGRGMPPEALGRLTEAFYRVDKSRSRAQGGVGLGLTLCREILDLHEGSLRFESREGGGTCVTVTLKEVEQ